MPPGCWRAWNRGQAQGPGCNHLPGLPGSALVSLPFQVTWPHPLLDFHSFSPSTSSNPCYLQTLIFGICCTVRYLISPLHEVVSGQGWAFSATHYDMFWGTLTPPIYSHPFWELCFQSLTHREVRYQCTSNTAMVRNLPVS